MTFDEAIAKFRSELPGWWWSIGDCSVSADASCGPDRTGPDAELLADRLFDEGFHCDLRQPASPVQSLMNVLDQAKSAKERRGNEKSALNSSLPRCHSRVRQ
jgi:hypothetical protein